MSSAGLLEADKEEGGSFSLLLQKRAKGTQGAQPKVRAPPCLHPHSLVPAAHLETMGGTSLLVLFKALCTEWLQHLLSPTTSQEAREESGCTLTESISQQSSQSCPQARGTSTSGMFFPQFYWTL